MSFPKRCSARTQGADETAAGVRIRVHFLAGGRKTLLRRGQPREIGQRRRFTRNRDISHRKGCACILPGCRQYIRVRSQRVAMTPRRLLWSYEMLETDLGDHILEQLYSSLNGYVLMMVDGAVRFSLRMPQSHTRDKKTTQAAVEGWRTAGVPLSSSIDVGAGGVIAGVGHLGRRVGEKR